MAVSALVERRVCTKCSESLPLDQFHKNAASPSGRHPWCKGCRSQSARKFYEAHPGHVLERQRWRNTKHRTGLTQSEYEAKLAAQGGVCAICGRTQERRLSVDHDHNCCSGSGQICGQCTRDLLCVNCNSLLGLAEDNTDRLLAAVAYLRRWSPSL